MQTYNQVVQSNFEMACTLSGSPHAEEVKKRVTIKETDTAEQEFSELLKQITDLELRGRIDSAVGKISYAYEKLGFVEGFIAEKSLSCIA